MRLPLLVLMLFVSASPLLAREGAIVVSIDAGSPAAGAGLRPGDRVVSWSRPASPPANPQPAEGPVRSWLDLLETEVEQGPRGTVTLRTERDGSLLSVDLPPTGWGLEARPDTEDPSGDEGDLACWSSYSSALRLVGADDVASAEGPSRSAISLALTSRRSGAAAALATRTARDLALRGARAASLGLLREALQEVERVSPGSLATALILVTESVVLQKGAIAEPIRQAASDALPIVHEQAPRSGLMAFVLEGLGVAATLGGDLRVAQGFLQQSLDLRTALAPASRDVGRSLLFLGGVASGRRDLEAAEPLFRKALEIQQRLAPGSPDEAYARIQLGLLSSQRLDLDDAEDHLRVALAFYEKSPPDPRFGVVLNALGTIASRREQHDLARSFFRRALDVFRERSPGSHNVVACLESLADEERRHGALDDAEALLLEALELSHRLDPDSPGDAFVEASLGSLAMERGDLEAAARWLQHSSSIWSIRAPGSWEHAVTLHSLGELHRRKGDIQGAADFFGRALDVIESQRERLGSSEGAAELLSGRFAAYYRDQIEVLVTLSLASEAWLTSERFRAQTLRARLAERELSSFEPIPPELDRERQRIEGDLDTAQGRLRELPAGAEEQRAQLLVELRSLRREHALVADRIRRASPRLGSVRYPRPLDFPAARRSLDPGTVLLAYVVGEARTILFVFGPRSAKLGTFIIPVGESELRQRTTLFRAVVDAPAAPLGGADELASGLFDLLLAPALPDLRQAKRVLVLPDGPLHQLPFGTLRVPERGGSFLAEWKPLHFAPSATIYSTLRGKRVAQAALTVAAFGDPTYPEPARLRGDDVSHAPTVRREVRRDTSFVGLPSSRREVQAITNLFPKRSAAFLGDEATEEQVKSLPRRVRYVHFACHALLNEQSPLDSALALAIRVRPAEGQDNGLLQAREIFEHVRLDADLVTLSACESGLGPERGGEGLVGLTQAFFYAGARSVVASLWSVDDDSTAELMRRFYRHLRDGRPKVEALRAAQLELIRAGYRPFHWAAFQLSGDWR